MKAIASFVYCLLAFGHVAHSAFIGKVAFWESNANSQTANKIKHTTRSINVGSAIEIPAGFEGKYEAIVHLRSGAALKHESVLNDIKSSSNAEVLANVRADSNLESAIAKGTRMSEARILSITELNDLIKEGSVLKDGKANAFTVSIADSVADKLALSTLLATTSSLSTGQVLYISSEESATTTAELPAGHYARQLSSATSSATTSATKTSAPATGAEFSIYYEGTYLYITPDIFTGLLTALFMLFVVLIGLNCLGDIQGMSSFYDRVPSNGKEA